MEYNLGDDEPKSSSISGIIFLGLCVLWIAYVYLKREDDKALVKANYGRSVGKIIEYQDRTDSDAGGIAITYQYHAMGKVYTRRKFSGIKFPECDKELSDACKKRRFWVIFSLSDPSKSLIDFGTDIQADSSAAVPESLGNFY
jgi:hypothetical protein